MAHSTGSPASRRSTKFTPLTTRPSFTSRQGMTRTLSTDPSRGSDQSKRLNGIEPSVIERAPDDRAGKARAIGRRQPGDVVDRSKAARGDDRNGDGLGQGESRLDVEALEHAVARNIGVDDR